jgi:hypothetical protein
MGLQPHPARERLRRKRLFPPLKKSQENKGETRVNLTKVRAVPAASLRRRRHPHDTCPYPHHLDQQRRTFRTTAGLSRHENRPTKDGHLRPPEPRYPSSNPSLSQLPPPPTTASWPHPTPSKPPHIQQNPLPFNPRQSRERPPLKEATKTQEAHPTPPPTITPSTNPNFHLSPIIPPFPYDPEPQKRPRTKTRHPKLIFNAFRNYHFGRFFSVDIFTISREMSVLPWALCR